MIEQKPEICVTAVLPLGVVTFDVSGSGATINVVPAEVPKLPEGMAVDGVMLVCVRLATQVTLESPVHIRATVDRDGDPETGEWLESIAFPNGNGVLQVAVRDDEWLAANGVIAESVEYVRQGFGQVINEAPAGTLLYVSAAWRADCVTNANGERDVSAWFAVDLVLPRLGRP